MYVVSCVSVTVTLSSGVWNALVLYPLRDERRRLGLRRGEGHLGRRGHENVRLLVELVQQQGALTVREGRHVEVLRLGDLERALRGLRGVLLPDEKRRDGIVLVVVYGEAEDEAEGQADRDHPEA